MAPLTSAPSGETREMWNSLRSGSWLDERRLAGYPILFLALGLAAVAATLATAQGRFDAAGHPLGTDFSQVWVAGLETLRGHPEAPFDLSRHIDAQRSEFGPRSDVYGWHYPPFFLAPAAALAALPYLQALTLWQIATLLFSLAAVLAILRDSGLARWRIIVAALAFPATLVNLGHGQNGFLTAGLLGFGFHLLRARPILAGVCFGLLAYKPQFALALPVALACGGCWRTIASAAATTAAMVLVSVDAFGAGSWIAFVHSLSDTRTIVLEDGAAGFAKIQSVFAAVRLLGGDIRLAYGAQSATTLLTIAALALLWRSRADDRAKAAATIVASLLATPYCLDYDMAALAPALAFMTARGMERGFGPYMKSALAAAYVIPLAARPLAAIASVPLGAATLAVLLAVIVLDALRDGAAARERSHSIFSVSRPSIFTKKSRLIRRARETFRPVPPLSMCRAIWRRIGHGAGGGCAGRAAGAEQSARESSVPREEASCR
ncbi:MAG TPA: glycosyltransferase family 87 protein [Methylosinus sp.]